MKVENQNADHGPGAPPGFRGCLLGAPGGGGALGAYMAGQPRLFGVAEPEKGYRRSLRARPS
jgi:hypothetical protein